LCRRAQPRSAALQLLASHPACSAKVFVFGARKRRDKNKSSISNDSLGNHAAAAPYRWPRALTRPVIIIMYFWPSAARALQKKLPKTLAGLLIPGARGGRQEVKRLITSFLLSALTFVRQHTNRLARTHFATRESERAREG
jgi:hypothetical protein